MQWGYPVETLKRKRKKKQEINEENRVSMFLTLIFSTCSISRHISISDVIIIKTPHDHRRSIII